MAVDAVVPYPIPATSVTKSKHPQVVHDPSAIEKESNAITEGVKYHLDCPLPVARAESIGEDSIEEFSRL